MERACLRSTYCDPEVRCQSLFRWQRFVGSCSLNFPIRLSRFHINGYTNQFVIQLLVRSNVSGWHQIDEDLVKLYYRLVDLGMEYRDGEMYLADLEEYLVDAPITTHLPENEKAEPHRLDVKENEVL